MHDALHLDADHLRPVCEIALAGRPVLIRVFEYDASAGATVANGITGAIYPTHVALLFLRGALVLVGTGQTWAQAAEDARKKFGQPPRRRPKDSLEQALPQFRPGHARA